MADRLLELMDGTTGHFWTKLDEVPDLTQAANGHVKLNDDNLLHIETLTSADVMRSMRTPPGKSREMPLVMYGATQPAGAVFFDLAGHANNRSFGGGRASSGTYRFRSVLCGVNLRNVASHKFDRMLVTFPEVTNWSGFDGVPVSPTTDEIGRSESVTAELRAEEIQATPTRRGISLSFSSRWSVSGPDDVRVFKNPLAVITESIKPKDWQDHVVRLIAVQDIINMAYQGFVVADVGTAHIDTKEDDPYAKSPDLWISRLMTIPPGAKAPKKMTEFPVFNFYDIGGIRGIDGWIELSRKYGRATGPVSTIYRFGSGLAVETRCMEIAAAIDYWSEIHRRAGANWADRSKGSLTEVLAKFAGPAFEKFVGDVRVWSKIFRDTYNRIKHEPVFSYDSGDVYTVTRSAEILLQSALLNRVARNKKMTHIVCDSHRNYEVGYDVRKIVSRGQL